MDYKGLILDRINPEALSVARMMEEREEVKYNHFDSSRPTFGLPIKGGNRGLEVITGYTHFLPDGNLPMLVKERVISVFDYSRGWISLMPNFQGDSISEKEKAVIETVNCFNNYYSTLDSEGWIRRE